MRKLFASLVITFLVAVPAYARQRAFGYCEDGGQATVTNGVVSTGVQPILGGSAVPGTGVQGNFPGCTVTVYNAGTLTLSTIYSTSGGASLTNPFTASTLDGSWFFYANDGKYDVNFSGGGIPIAFTRPDYLLCDGCAGVGSGVQLVPVSSQTIAQPLATFFLVNRFEGLRFADQFPSITAAISDAGANGATVVPPNYIPSDTYTAPNAGVIFDWRGFVKLYAANGSTPPSAGNPIVLNAGNGGATGPGGQVNLVGGNGGATSGSGGDINLTAGNSPTGQGGSVHMVAGTGVTPGAIKVDSPIAVPIANSLAGTVVSELVSYNTSGQAIVTPSGTNAGAIGVCMLNCGSSGTAYVAQIGQVTLNLDNSGTAGDYVCISSTSAGFGTDCGTNPSSGQIVASVVRLVSGSLYTVLLNVGVPNPSSVLGNAVTVNPSSSSGNTVQPTVSTVVPLTLKCPTGAASTLNCLDVQNSAGAHLFQVTQGGSVIFGTGTGGVVSAGAIYGALTTVAFSASPTFNLQLSNAFLITLTGNVTSSALANMPTSSFSQPVTFIICQDGTGNRTFVPPANVVGFTPISPTAGACSVQTFTTQGTQALASSTGAAGAPSTASPTYVVDGGRYATICQVVQNIVPINTAATIVSTFAETGIPCDPFNQTRVIRLLLTYATSAYTSNVPWRIGTDERLEGSGRGNAGGGIVKGTQIQPSASYTNPFISTTPSGFTNGTTSSGCGTPPNAGTYQVEETWGPDVTRETTAANETAVVLSGSNCFLITPPVSPPAGVTTYDVYISAAGGASGSEVWAKQAAIGTTSTITFTGTAPVAGSGHPPNQNNTGAFIVIGNANGAQGTAGSTQANFGSVVKDLSINCADTTGAIAAAILTGEEGSGLFNVDGQNCPGVTMFTWEGYGNLGVAASNSRVRDVTMNQGNTSNPTVASFYIDGMTSIRGLDGFTCTPLTSTTPICVLVNNLGIPAPIGGTIIMNGHMEKATDGIKAISGHITVMNVTCSPSNVTNCVHFDTNSSSSVAIGVRGGSACGVLDDSAGSACITQGYLGPYFNGAVSNTFQEVGAAPTCTSADIGASGTCAIQTGGSNTSGRMLVTFNGAGINTPFAITLTYAGANGLGANNSSCMYNPISGGTAWADNTTHRSTASGTGSNVERWINGGGAGTPFIAGNSVGIEYNCRGY